MIRTINLLRSIGRLRLILSNWLKRLTIVFVPNLTTIWLKITITEEFRPETLI